MPSQKFCAHFTLNSNDSHMTLTHTRSLTLGVSAVAMVTTPLKYPFLCSPCENFIVARFYSICAHFSHAQRVLQLNLPHHDSFGLGVSAVAMVTTPPKSSKIAIFAHLCPPRHFVHTFHMSQTIHI